MIRNFIYIFFAIIVSAQSAFASEPRTVLVGAFNSYPLIFQDSDGHIDGLYVDLLNEIGLKENIRFEYVYGTWKEGLDRIKTGDVDMLTSVGFTQERAKYMDYCSTPLLTVWGELYTIKTSNVNGILDISGKKVGVLKDDIFLKNFRELTAEFGINCIFIELTSYEDVFKAIAAKEVDAGIVDVTFGTAKYSEYGLRPTGVVFNPLDIFFTTGKNKNHDLRTLLDVHLVKLKQQDNSLYSQSKQKWLYGSVGAVAVTPGWLNNFLIALGIFIAVALTFIVLLRRQVQKATFEIQQNEKALRNSENRLRTLIQTIPDLIWLKDTHGVYLTCNTMFERFFGANESAIKGKTDYYFVNK